MGSNLNVYIDYCLFLAELSTFNGRAQATWYTSLVPSTAAVAFQDRLFEGVIKGFESMKDMSEKPE